MAFELETNDIAGIIKKAVSKIANESITGSDGTVLGTKKTWGYVCAINEDGEYAGTVDVQEYHYTREDWEKEGQGHHKGVKLSAIQDNRGGYRIVPLLYSEVIITTDPYTLNEYVLMYSHAQRIELNAHEKVEISAEEREDFVETDDGIEKDYDELESTGNKSSTTYTPQSITDKVVSEDDEEGLVEEKTAAQKTIKVGDTTVTIDGSNVTITTSGEVNISTDKATIKGGDVTITGGNLTVKGKSNTDLQGPFNSIVACPFSGAPHCGSMVSGT